MYSPFPFPFQPDQHAAVLHRLPITYRPHPLKVGTQHAGHALAMFGITLPSPFKSATQRSPSRAPPSPSFTPPSPLRPLCASPPPRPTTCNPSPSPRPPLPSPPHRPHRPLRRARAAAGVRAGLRTCRNCKQGFEESGNHGRACRHHPGVYTGDSRRKGTWERDGGGYATGDGAIERFWWYVHTHIFLFCAFSRVA